MSGFNFYKELVEDKISALIITTPKKTEKANKKALADGGVDDTATKAKKSKPKKVKADENCPLKKPKNTMTGFAGVFVEDMKKLANEKRADGMNKLIDDVPVPNEEQEEGDGDDDDNDEGGEEDVVVEETQPEELDPVLKARKKFRLGVA